MKILKDKKLAILGLISLGILATCTGYFVQKNAKENVTTQHTDTKNITPKGHSLVPVSSNKWYSSVYKNFPTQPLYTYPIAYKISESGLSFSYPDTTATPDTIFAPFVEDFTIGTESKLSKPEIKHIGDWSINLEQKSTNATITYTLASGIPYTTINTTAEKIALEFPNNFKLYDQNHVETPGQVQTDSFVISTRNHNYLFVLPQKAQVVVQTNLVTISKAPSIYVALLDKRENYKLFKTNALSQIENTYAVPNISNSKLEVTYTTESTTNDSLQALMPHQFANLKTPAKSLGTYKTLRGNLNLVKAPSFTTEASLIEPGETFKEAKQNKEEIASQIKKDIETFINTPKPTSQNYFLGTWFGKASTLIQLADTYDLQSDKGKLISYIKPIFKDSLDFFKYDDDQKSLVSTKPEFGNENLNDHHFHYSYFIRLASVLAAQDPSLQKDYSKTIESMVTDIANINRTSENAPYLRNFDIWEGHGWADGYADFADGNNQESSSEAINAWYSLYLWSQVTKNDDLKKYALYLYNTEIQSAYRYWFDTNDIYQKPYNHEIASLLWGGKVDYKTWFSNETNMKYGIILLPITPASTYLANIPNFEKYQLHFNSTGGDVSKPWGDLFTIWESFHNPESAISKIETVTKHEDNTPRSLFLHMLYSNLEAE